MMMMTVMTMMTTMKEGPSPSALPNASGFEPRPVSSPKLWGFPAHQLLLGIMRTAGSKGSVIRGSEMCGMGDGDRING